MKSLMVRVWVGVACALVAGGCLSRQVVSLKENHNKKYDTAHVTGGSGESYDSAAVIAGGKDYTDAIACQDNFIGNAWGAKDKDWRLVEKTTMVEKGRTYDMVQVEIPKVGEKHFYYFDVTHYKKKKSSGNHESGESGDQPAPNKAVAPAERASPQQPRDSASAPRTVPEQHQQAAQPAAGPDTSKAPAAK